MKKFFQEKPLKAFTLMELMIVVVIIGIVAAFGIPSYSKAVNKAIGQDALNNLRIIMSAQEGYKAFEGGNDYYPDGMWIANTADLNTALHLNIIEQKGLIYTCQTVMTMADVFCTARIPGQWSMIATLPGPSFTCFPAAKCPQVTY